MRSRHLLGVGIKERREQAIKLRIEKRCIRSREYYVSRHPKIEIQVNRAFQWQNSGWIIVMGWGLFTEICYLVMR